MKQSRHALAIVGALALGAALLVGLAPSAAASIGFGKSVLQGDSVDAPTALQFGPDGRLYVLERVGDVKVYSIDRVAANSYRVVSSEVISLVRTIANHDDDGAPNPSITTRQATGLLVTGTASRPVIYVSSSDPRSGGGQQGDTNLDTNSGTVTRLTKTTSGWRRLNLVQGLPRSEEVHSVNGMALDASTNTLYLAVGGHTNMGAPSTIFANLPEYALSGAILSIDLSRIGNTTYNLPTLDDSSRAGNPDANDPFGGNDGNNQAVIDPGGPVQVYSPGYRNPYSVIIASSGLMYAVDNGHNAGQGGLPVGEGTHQCTNDLNPADPGVTGPDSIHLVAGPGYYAGHPNPTRGNQGNTWSGGQSPVPQPNPVECDYLAPGTENGAIATDVSSTNGMTEYTASNFHGALKGDLLLAAFDNYVTRLHLSTDGASVASKTTLFSNVGNHPLGLTSLGDGGPFPGTVWLADFGLGAIYVFEPNDYAGGGSRCRAKNTTTADRDQDGYSNADEIDNGTNPCSAADVPPDWDSDFLSNLNDIDDDNDGLPDTSDPFAIDPSNGMDTVPPVTYTFDPSTYVPHSLLSLGFTGLMTNRFSDYESLFDRTQLTAGGAPGALTVDKVTDGDATGVTNTQEYAFQFGALVTPSIGVVTAHTRIIAPFDGLNPGGNQSMGLFLGTGDQDNYLKLVLSANNGSPGVQRLREVKGVVTAEQIRPLRLPGPDFVDLYLRIDPTLSTVQPSYSVTTGGVTGARQQVGLPLSIPARWTAGTSSLSVGIISTAVGNAPGFPASWDFIKLWLH